MLERIAHRDVHLVDIVGQAIEHRQQQALVGQDDGGALGGVVVVRQEVGSERGLLAGVGQLGDGDGRQAGCHWLLEAVGCRERLDVATDETAGAVVGFETIATEHEVGIIPKEIGTVAFAQIAH